MGGSAIGADLAVAVIGCAATRPIVTVIRSYDLPSWVGEGDAVVLSSATRARPKRRSPAFEQATQLGREALRDQLGRPDLRDRRTQQGIPLIGLPGIFQPRAAVAYGVVAVIEIAIANGIVAGRASARTSKPPPACCADSRRVGPDSPMTSLPKKLAREAFGRLPIDLRRRPDRRRSPIAGSARSTRTPSVPAWNAALSEANHNEICGWEGAAEIRSSNAAWFLRDADQNERDRRAHRASPPRSRAAMARAPRSSTSDRRVPRSSDSSRSCCSAT